MFLQLTPGDISVGFTICSGTCITSYNSSSRTSHTFFSLDPQQFVGVPFRECVTLQKNDCTGTNESVEFTGKAQYPRYRSRKFCQIIFATCMHAFVDEDFF